MRDDVVTWGGASVCRRGALCSGSSPQDRWPLAGLRSCDSGCLASLFFVVFLSVASGVRADVTFETGPLFLGHAKDLASVMGVGEAASLV